MIRPHELLPILCLTMLSGSVVAQSPIPNFDQFLTCIKSTGQGSICQLEAGEQYIYQPVVIERSNITVAGRGMGATILHRNQLYPDSTLKVASNVTGVTITQLEIFGNRDVFPCQGLDTFPIELDAGRGNTIRKVRVTFAPGGGVALLDNSSIYESEIIHTRNAGLFMMNNTVAESNSIQYSGTAGINVSGAGAKVKGNWLFKNRIEDDIGGGQIFVERGTSSNEFSENTIDGNDYISDGSPVHGCAVPAGIRSHGVEGYGSGHKFFNNEVRWHSGHGMYFTDASGIVISGNNPGCPVCAPKSVHHNQFEGIWFFPIFDWTTTNITLDHVRSQDNGKHGVKLQSVQSGPGFVNDACLTGNAEGPVWVMGGSVLDNPEPATGTACP
ncbi:MAG: right-handed parallel beta-helix repeat-containing protein [Terriglobales bacterium]